MAIISKMTFDNGSTKNLISSTFYGKCITAAATAAKTVTIGGWDESVKDNVSGATVHVYFTLGNSATDPTLNIDSGGAHPIYVEDSVKAAAFPAGVYCLTLVSFVISGQATWCWLMEAKTDWSYISNKPSLDFIPTSQKGASSGVAELDANGKVPASQLPAYVDDVIEYTSKSIFPTVGVTGVIYVDTTANTTWRWSGSEYVQIKGDLVLGETSSTAYRGDRGATAYSHATDSNRLTTAQSSGLYKFATTAEGHIASVTAVQKSDITGLGIPAQDTTYTFDGTYNASTNKAATVKTVTDAIDALDGSVTGSAAASKTLKSFSQTNGVVTAEFEDISITKSQISDFPASMPASDVSSWAKASTKPSYALSELTGASDVQAIEALTGTSGFLKKTAADTWSLDTTSYLPTSGGTMEGRVNLPGAPLNPGFTGTGVAARDAGSGASPRYFPATWTFNTGFTATDGDIFFLEVPVAGHSNGVYISVDNGQHYYPAVVQTTSRLTTHYAVGNLVAFVFEADGSAASMYALNGGNDRVTVTGGVFRVFNYYDANTNTLQRTFRSTTNVELPVAGISTSSSATAAYSAISSGSYKDVYAAIPNDTAKVVSLNPSTGYLTFKALTANQAVKTDANKRLVSNNLAVTTATDESTEATRFVHSVTEDAVGKITVKTRPMPTIPNVPSAPTTAGNYNLNINNGTASWQEESYPTEILTIVATPESGDIFSTTILYTDFLAAISAGKIIQISIPTYAMSGILNSKTGGYYTFNVYNADDNTVYNYVFSDNEDNNNLLQLVLEESQKSMPSGFQVAIPNAGHYVLSSTGSETAWVKSTLEMTGTPLGNLTQDYITTTTSWQDYQVAISSRSHLILSIPTINAIFELTPQETDGSLVNAIAHMALGNDVYVSLFTFSASNNSGTVQFRYNNQIISYTEKAYNATNARYTEYFANSEGLSDGNYILNQNSGTSTWTTLPTIPAIPTVGSISLTTTWSGNGPYTQTVSISGGTANSKIDLQPNSTVLTQLMTDGVTAMYIENNNGTFTAYALGATPSAALNIQYTRTEVTS